MFAKAHGAAMMAHLHSRNPDGTTEYALRLLGSKVKEEAQRLAVILSRQELGSVTRILEAFSMPELIGELMNTAPVFMALLQEVVLTEDKKSRVHSQGNLRPPVST